LIQIDNKSVTEIVGTLLLLALAISVLSYFYVVTINDEGPSEKTIVKIIGKVESSNFILEHQGGENLGTDTKIDFSLGGIDYSFLVGELLNDKNNNLLWNLGERLVFPQKVFQYPKSLFHYHSYL